MDARRPVEVPLGAASKSLEITKSARSSKRRQTGTPDVSENRRAVCLGIGNSNCHPTLVRPLLSGTGIWAFPVPCSRNRREIRRREVPEIDVVASPQAEPPRGPMSLGEGGAASVGMRRLAQRAVSAVARHGRGARPDRPVAPSRGVWHDRHLRSRRTATTSALASDDDAPSIPSLRAPFAPRATSPPRSPIASST